MNCPLCSSPQRNKWSHLPRGFVYWICSECKLIWLDESQRPTRDFEEARYLTHQNATDSAGYIAYLQRIALPVVERVPKGSRGLDYGCGPTEGMKAALSEFSFSVESYDPIFFPREELLKNSYVFLLCSEAAEHFFFPGQEFARLDTLLKSGGFLGVSSRLAVSQEAFPLWSYRRDPTHVVFYNRETVHWIAQRFGWKLVQLDDPLWIFHKP
jgi:hypothetical protein